MKVVIAKQVLDEPQYWRQLDRLIDLFDSERHHWQIDDPDAIEKSVWLNQDVGSRRQLFHLEIFQQHFQQSIYPQGNKMHQVGIEVTPAGNSPNQLSPEEAWLYLNTPLRVAVEDRESDGAFLETMLQAFKRKDLCQALTTQWWDFEHLGGFGKTERRIETLEGKTTGPLRLLVIVDSDREYPGDDTATVKKVTESCRKANVPFCILSKRKIENYLPITVLQKKVSRKNKKTLQAFLRLSRKQQDYYEMKRGFKKDSHGPFFSSDKQKVLFADLVPGQIKCLCGGFGSHIADWFKSERKVFTAEMMRQTCPDDSGEIERILDEIEALL